MRFQLSEITPKRVFNAAMRRCNDLPHRLAWELDRRSANSSSARLQKLKNLHKNERCFILANGPSLAKTDLSGLKDECTFGMNRIYLLFEQLNFIPTYYCCNNELVLEQFSKDIQALTMTKFLNWNSRALFSQEPNQHFLRYGFGLRDHFATNLGDCLSSGGTVTYTCLLCAYFMGFKEVVLVGLDHSFAEKGTPNKTEVRKQERDESHFHPNYFPKGVKWQLPDLVRSEQAYELARQAFTRDGRKIIDATQGGQCTVFPKMDLQDYLRQTSP